MENILSLFSKNYFILLSLINRILGRTKKNVLAEHLKVMAGIPLMERLAVTLNVARIKKEIEEDEYNQELYKWEFRHDIALNALLNALTDNSQGSTDITWNLYDPILKTREKFEFKAYHIDMDTWRLMKLYAEDSIGCSEGYSFTFKIPKNLNKIKMPCCYCDIVSDNVTIRGNYIDSNCDVWGSQYNSKAERLYAFYLTDKKRYAVVYSSYYCL